MQRYRGNSITESYIFVLNHQQRLHLMLVAVSVKYNTLLYNYSKNSKIIYDTLNLSISK